METENENEYENENENQTLRRSTRKTKEDIEKEHVMLIEASLALTDDKLHGLIVVNTKDKGRGVQAAKDFSQGDFVVEYAGELLEIEEAEEREKNYGKDIGSYMYFFEHNGKKYCIDATAESERIGRLINHSRISPNCMTKVAEVNNVPRLYFSAMKSISEGDEILYDYKDRSKEATTANPWLKKSEENKSHFQRGDVHFVVQQM